MHNLLESGRCPYHLHMRLMSSHAWFVTPNITNSAVSLTYRLCSGAGASLGIHGVPFQQMMRSIYERFVDEKVEACVQRCREDLFGMTRYSSCFDVRLCAGPEFCDACAGVKSVDSISQCAFYAVPLHVSYHLFSCCCSALTATLTNIRPLARQIRDFRPGGQGRRFNPLPPAPHASAHGQDGGSAYPDQGQAEER
jgi:hypothetical protein